MIPLETAASAYRLYIQQGGSYQIFLLYSTIQYDTPITDTYDLSFFQIKIYLGYAQK